MRELYQNIPIDLLIRYYSDRAYDKGLSEQHHYRSLFNLGQIYNGVGSKFEAKQCFDQLSDNGYAYLNTEQLLLLLKFYFYTYKSQDEVKKLFTRLQEKYREEDIPATLKEEVRQELEVIEGLMEALFKKTPEGEAADSIRINADTVGEAINSFIEYLKKLNVILRPAENKTSWNFFSIQSEQKEQEQISAKLKSTLQNMRNHLKLDLTKILEDMGAQSQEILNNIVIHGRLSTLHTQDNKKNEASGIEKDDKGKDKTDDKAQSQNNQPKREKVHIFQLLDLWKLQIQNFASTHRLGLSLNEIINSLDPVTGTLRTQMPHNTQMRSTMAKSQIN